MTNNYGQFPGDTYGDPDEAEQLPSGIPDEDGDVHLRKKAAKPKERRPAKARKPKAKARPRRKRGGTNK